MGIKEFSTQIADFNQEQIDLIEQATNDILVAVNAIKDTDISQLNDKFGAIEDDYGDIDTVFARLQYLMWAYEDTLSVLTNAVNNARDNINANVDTERSTITTAVNNARDNVKTHVTAAVDGLQLALRLGSLQNELINTVNTAKNAVRGRKPKRVIYSGTMSTGVWYTLVDITGAGTVGELLNHWVGCRSQYHNIKITIDGVTETINNTTGASSLLFYQNQDCSRYAPSGLHFNTSLKVEVQGTNYVSGTTITGNTIFDYTLV